MAEQVLRKLSTQFDIHFNNLQQLRSGPNLILIAFKVLYHQHNDFLSSKLSGINPKNQSFSKSQLNESLISNQSSATKPGNNVILINALLKHIKSDKCLLLPNSIKQLTFYNILEEDQLLCRFIEWMMMENQKQTKIHSNKCETYPQQNFESEGQNFQPTSSSHFKTIQIKSAKAKENQRFETEERQTINKILGQQENELENLYFASNLKEKLTVDPQPQNTDKIVRKGSFKLLKPKVMFSQQSNSDQQPKQLQESNRIHKKQFEIYEPDELKEISMIEPSQPHNSSNQGNIQANFDNQASQLNDSIDELVNKKIANVTPSASLQKQNHRKTVPKNLSKPPLYRSSIKNKQNLHTESKTIEQKSKRKNFFHFQNQGQQIVSNFNDETIKNTMQMKINQQKSQLCLRQIHNNETEKLKSMKKSVHHLYDIEGSNVIEEDEGHNMQENIQFDSRRITSNTLQSSFTNSSSLLKLKNHFLQKQLYTLDKQILNQSIQHTKQQLIHDQNNSGSLHNNQSKDQSFSSTKRENRKVSKIHIRQIEDTTKQDILEWLIRIRVIEKSINLHELPQIFKNGVKFVQLCNHYIGRGRAIPYFNNPKKNAQIHSNFSKVFEHLKSFSNFSQKELLFAYQMFVPHPQQGSIWNLLETIYTLLHKRPIKPRNSKSKDQSQYFQQQSRNASTRKGKQGHQQENGKNNFSNKHIEFINNNGSSSVLNKQRSSSSFKNRSGASSCKQSTFSKPIEFVPFVPEISRHHDLVQQSEEPDENQAKNLLNINENGVNNNVLTEGYKQKYFRRAIDTSISKDQSKSSKQFFSLQTPKKQIIQNKQQSFTGNQNSKILERSLINRSSSKKALECQIKKLETSSHKLTSIRKNSSKKALSKLSKVTLNMQMKVQRLINEQNLGEFLNNSNENNQFKGIQLLEDPIRNGRLINILLARIQFQDIKHIKTPQSIEHCRLNYKNIFNIIKNKYGQQLFKSFQIFTDLVEQILKGEKNIFYSIAYQMISIANNKKGENYNSINILENTPDNYNDSQSKHIHMKNITKSQMIRLYCHHPIQWVRLLQMTNPLISALKIRTLDDLYTHISTSAFLYSLLQNPTISMVYLNPLTVNEKQANVKKALICMIQMRILNREDFINTRQIAVKNNIVIENLLQKLVNFTVNKEWNYIVRNMSSLRRILLKQSGIKKTQQTNFNNTNNGSLNFGFNQTGVKSDSVQNHCNELRIHPLQSMKDIVNSNIQQVEGKGLPSTQKIKDKYQNDQEKKQFEVEIPWMRKLGFTNCSLKLNNGILLCRLISKLTRTNIKFNQNIAHDAQIPKPQSLAYIRKALKLIPGCRMDELDVYNADERKSLQIYSMIKDRFRTNYEMDKVANVR